MIKGFFLMLYWVVSNIFYGIAQLIKCLFRGCQS